jgi:hypothetical protein
MRNKLNSLLLLLFLLVPGLALSQDLFVPTMPSDGSQTLLAVIKADTVANPAIWQAGSRVYVLARNGNYPWDNSLTVPKGRHLRIRSEYRSDSTMPQIYLYNIPTGTTNRPPGQIANINGDCTMSNVLISGYNEWDLKYLDGIQGQIFGCPVGAGLVHFRLDSCIFKSVNGQFLRTDGQATTIHVNDCIIADMGFNGQSNFGAGKGVDARNMHVDTLDLQNNTWVNIQDRVIRHYQSIYPIVNLWFNNNTVVNAMSFHSMLSLGKVDSNGIGTVQIKNNMLIDHFALGADTCTNRQQEWADGLEHDSLNWGRYTAPGYAGDGLWNYRMTWIVAAPYGSVSTGGAVCQPMWDIQNNVWSYTDSGAVMVSGWMMKPYNSAYGSAYRNFGPPLTWDIAHRMAVQTLYRDTLTAFKRCAIQLVNTPPVMTKMIRWQYRDLSDLDPESGKGGSGKSKGGNAHPNFTETITKGVWYYDYNRQPAAYYLTLFSCNFISDTTLSGIGARRWVSAGSTPNLVTQQNLGKGWNLLSLPRLRTGKTTLVSTAYPDALGDAYRYDTTPGVPDPYPVITDAAPGIGMWVNMGVARPTHKIYGVASTEPMKIPVKKKGWVLVGGRTWDTPTSALQFLNGGAMNGDAYAYNNSTHGYDIAPSIPAGQAVWVLTTQADTILVP